MPPRRGEQPTYAEAVAWARWLEVFTALELSESMAIAPQLALRFVKALVWNGSVRPVDALMNGHGELDIVEYIPLPPGPSEHPHETPPELATPGVYSETPRRGLPVSMSAGRSRRSGVGQWRPGRQQQPPKEKKT